MADVRHWLTMPHTSRQAIYGSIVVGLFALYLSALGFDLASYAALGAAAALFVQSIRMDE